MLRRADLAPAIPVFNAQITELSRFSRYVSYLESVGAHKSGLVKIIPPDGYTARRSGYNLDLVISHPTSQYITGHDGIFLQKSNALNPMRIRNFIMHAKQPRNSAPSYMDCQNSERTYWKNLLYGCPTYSGNTSGTLFDNDSAFNMQQVKSILDFANKDSRIQNLVNPHLEFSMWKTASPWQTENMDLYAINYLHFGYKMWYVIPPQHGYKFQSFIASIHPEGCSSFLRHHTTIISPTVLKENFIPFQKIDQKPGEIIIAFPFAHHFQFSCGYSCNEKVNFAIPRWVDYGKRAALCTCKENKSINFSMEQFVLKYQPDQFEMWKEGKDIGAHPEDLSKQYAVGPLKFKK